MSFSILLQMGQGMGIDNLKDYSEEALNGFNKKRSFGMIRQDVIVCKAPTASSISPLNTYYGEVTMDRLSHAEEDPELPIFADNPPSAVYAEPPDHIQQPECQTRSDARDQLCKGSSPLAGLQSVNTKEHDVFRSKGG